MSLEQTPDIQTGPPEDVVNYVSTLEDLPLYQHAATNSGYRITIIAQEGETYPYWEARRDESEHFTNEWFQRPVVIPEGRVAISIVKPDDQQDFGPFWDVYRAYQSYYKIKPNSLLDRIRQI